MNGAWSVVLVVPRGTQVLVQKRGFISNDLNFPGGNAIAEDRTAQHTAVRKLLEETGLIAEVHDFACIDTWIGNAGQNVYAYLVNKYRGRPRSSNGGRVFWTKQYQMLSAASSTFGVYNGRVVRKLLTIRPAAVL